MTTDNLPERDTTLDPDTFDIGEWLGDVDPDQYRPKRTVHVYIVRPGLSDEIDQLRAEHDKYTAAVQRVKQRQGERSIADAGPAVYESRLDDIEQRMEQAMQRVEGSKRTIEVVGRIQPETDATVRALPEGTTPYDRTVALLATACRVNGKPVSPEGLTRLHRAIGDGQWHRLVQAYNETTTGDPWGGVTAPF